MIPWCRGVVLLGLDAPEAELAKAFHATAKHGIVKGFAVGRTIFTDAAQRWLAGTASDKAAVDAMAERFGSLVSLWSKAREQAPGTDSLNH